MREREGSIDIRGWVVVRGLGREDEEGECVATGKGTEGLG